MGKNGWGGCKFKSKTRRALEAEVGEGVIKVIELEWSGNNPLLEVHSDMLEAIELHDREEFSFL